MNANLEAAEATANNDRHPETIKGYKRIIKKMTEFARVQEAWDEAIFDDPPLPDEFVKEFMGMQSQPKDDGSRMMAQSELDPHLEKMCLL